MEHVVLVKACFVDSFHGEWFLVKGLFCRPCSWTLFLWRFDFCRPFSWRIFLVKACFVDHFLGECFSVKACFVDLSVGKHISHIFVWGFCFSSLTPGSFSFSSSSSFSVASPLTLHKLHHSTCTQVNWDNVTYTTHLTPLISHNLSHAAQPTQLISPFSPHNSTCTTPL